MYLPYVYKLTNRHTNEFYIGMRSANKVPAEEDLGKKYFTSSRRVKANFQDFDLQIIAYFQDWESAFEFENQTIKSFWGDRLLLNRHFQKNSSSFSMLGMKRPDVSIANLSKRKPREIRSYVCMECSAIFEKEELCHWVPKNKPFCSHSCSARYVGKQSSLYTTGRKYPGRVAWNKGIPNPKSAENARRGASKMSSLALGRKRKYLDDGSWTWEYPATSVTEQAGAISES